MFIYSPLRFYTGYKLETVVSAATRTLINRFFLNNYYHFTFLTARLPRDKIDTEALICIIY